MIRFANFGGRADKEAFLKNIAIQRLFLSENMDMTSICEDPLSMEYRNNEFVEFAWRKQNEISDILGGNLVFIRLYRSDKLAYIKDQNGHLLFRNGLVEQATGSYKNINTFEEAKKTIEDIIDGRNYSLIVGEEN